MSTLAAVTIGIGFLTGVSWLVLASLAHAFRADEVSLPQPLTDEPGQ